MDAPTPTQNRPILTPEQEAAVQRLESNLGYFFENRACIETALRHRSYVHQFKESNHDHTVPEDNQRLEFLGDAVLSLTVGTLLYDRFPNRKEGQLSRMRAGLVNEHHLANMARDIELDEAALLGRGEETSGGRNKNSILADAFEAVLAAVYLDGGFEAALVVVKKLWGDFLDRTPQDDFLKDFKTQLQETTQKLVGQTPEYRLTGASGPDHARIFEITVYLDDREAGRGLGRSKKEAEQQAAEAALSEIESGAFNT